MNCIFAQASADEALKFQVCIEKPVQPLELVGQIEPSSPQDLLEALSRALASASPSHTEAHC